MTVTELLRKAAALLRQGWCQEALALNQYGLSTNAEDPDAVRWCVSGALCRVVLTSGGYVASWNGWDPDVLARKVLARMIEPDYDEATVGPSTVIVGWNDTPGRTQAEVIELFERAIAAA